MTRSLSSVERGNPPPRRKSCAACIKAKRRCDLRQPACLRCAQRWIECVYPCQHPASTRSARKDLTQPAPREPKRAATQLAEVPATSAGAAAPRGGEEEAILLSEPSLQDFGLLDTITTEAVEESLGLIYGSHWREHDSGCPYAPVQDPESPAMPGMDMFNFADPGNSGQVQDLEAAIPPRALDVRTAAEEVLPPAPHLLDLVETRCTTWVSPPTLQMFPQIAETLESRLRYAFQEIRRAPQKMVLENGTPWSHPILYRDGMPRSMQDAHACCALYMAKNHVNSPVIFRAIESRLQDLLNSPEPTTPRETLARTHALLLYQIIRLLDGDMLARAAAEVTIPALESAALALWRHTSFDCDNDVATGDGIDDNLALYPLDAAKQALAGYAFAESARRTLLIVFFFLQLYRLMSGETPLFCDGRLGLCRAWTLSAHLWRARDPFDFAAAWRGHRHFVVRETNIDEVLAEARGDDVDEFGKILITSLMGVDEAKGWFMSRGGSL